MILCHQINKKLADKPLAVAFAVAIPVWILFYLSSRPVIDLSWPCKSPTLFLLLGVLYPAIEELVFRGLIQGELMQKQTFRHSYAGISRANMLTSLLFAAAHLYAHPFTMAMLVFVPSLIFGYFRDRFDGWLLPPILLHTYYNLGYFLIFKPM